MLGDAQGRRPILRHPGCIGPKPAGQVGGGLFLWKDIAKVGVTRKRNKLRLLLFLEVRRRRCVFFVVADDPLDGADLEYGALDAAHCQRNRAKRHDKSPTQIHGRLARRRQSDGTPGRTIRGDISRRRRALTRTRERALWVVRNNWRRDIAGLIVS